MQFKEVLYPPGATRRDWVVDVTLAATGIIGQLASNLVLGYPYYPRTPWELFVCLAMLGSLVLRRHSPLLTLGLVTVFSIAHLSTMNRPTFSLVAVPIVAYAVARWVPGLITRSVLIIGAIGSFVGPYRWFLDRGGYLDQPARGDMLFFTFACLCFGAVATPYVIGRRGAEGEDAREREREGERERFARAAREREQQARLAEASTRAQIARELHDVVAHSLAIMIVQAEGGRASARKNPDAAAQALDTIAGVGRESLTEMRRIVGVLRGATDGADLAPAPTLAGLAELVQRTSDRVTLVTSGTPSGLSPALELTVYRVVQEALTNVLKHTGPDAHARVDLAYESTRVVVEITDDGRPGATASEPGGNGLRGMRERVAAMGGVLTAGPRLDADGFRVRAEIPVNATLREEERP
ncbi:sensor histidine kinase [Propioniciclava tarda]|uniref:histidine kinase n=1 Tax=Propioniciclava tarda TaxID=433330 RepID=A0A4Q9KNW1_PROTD|nr:sensor histidine kinase [Propioniciclava tarda]TBT96174.1 sensor histidine kinase [Propioniciclava tarda]SMO32815.1 Signal transduction histidine kinase [Propioniciclava tarda]